MGTFSWLGGDISNAFHWVSGGSAGTEPGPTDTAIFSAGGAVTGAANVGTANFSGAYVFSGATLLAGTETLSAGGSIVQKDGINAIVSAGHSLALVGANYTLSGGTLSAPQAAEFLSGTFKQFSGTNTAGGISIAGTYTLAGGTLSVVSGVDGLELVGAFGSSGGFIQSGGTHTVGGNLFIGSGFESGSGGSGLYDLDGQSTLTISQHVVLGVVSGTIGTLNIDSAGKPGAIFIVSATDSATALTVGSAGSGVFNQFAGSATLKSFNSATPALDVGATSSGSGFVAISGGTFAVVAGSTGGAAGSVSQKPHFFAEQRRQRRQQLHDAHPVIGQPDRAGDGVEPVQRPRRSVPDRRRDQDRHYFRQLQFESRDREGKPHYGRAGASRHPKWASAQRKQHHRSGCR
jgi:hypothetical protein